MKAPASSSAGARRTASQGGRAALTRRWSHAVTERSDALDLEPDVFRSRSPKRIAASLKRSAEHSTRRKSAPYRSAMSMLNFYVNRAGKNLSPGQRRVLERAKHELRALYGRSQPSRGRAGVGRSRS